VEADQRAVADDRERHGAHAARDQGIVRLFVFVDVLRRKRYSCA